SRMLPPVPCRGSERTGAHGNRARVRRRPRTGTTTSTSIDPESGSPRGPHGSTGRLLTSPKKVPDFLANQNPPCCIAGASTSDAGGQSSGALPVPRKAYEALSQGDSRHLPRDDPAADAGRGH